MPTRKEIAIEGVCGEDQGCGKVAKTVFWLPDTNQEDA
jgi:hypothetical protein